MHTLWWKRIANAHLAVYFAVLTAVVAIIVPQAAAWLESRASRFNVDILVMDDSDRLIDMSIVTGVSIDLTNGVAPENAVKVGAAMLKVVVKNGTKDEIRILDVKALVQNVAPILTGSLIVRTAQGAPTEQMAIFLRADIPSFAREVGSDGPTAPSFFSLQSIVIPPGGSEVLEVTVIPDDHDYRYRLQVEYLDGSSRVVARNIGDTFEVSGYSSNYDSAYIQTGTDAFSPLTDEEVRRHVASSLTQGQQ